MKTKVIFATMAHIALFSIQAFAQATPGSKPTNNLYIEIHHFGEGKVKFADVKKAYKQDQAVGKEYNVHFLNYWVDEAEGNVYCLSSARDSASIRKTHAKAHGLMPDQIYLVTSGKAAKLKPGAKFFFDVHNLGAGNVKAADVVGVHKKDLAVQGKYGVNLVNYWVNELHGKVFCLAQAPNSQALVNTHKEAHGLLPASVKEVKQGH